MKHYPIKNLLGINCHPWDISAHPDETDSAAKTARLQAAIIGTGFTWLRIYADAWAYKTDDNKAFKFNPQGNGYLTDDAIKALKAAKDIKTNICYQNAPKNIQAEWAGKKNTSYRHVNTDPSNPATWDELSNDMAVIAARGGKNVNAPDYPVYVSPNWWEAKQQVLKGTGLYDQVEAQNELDNNWSNDQFLNGTQYAVLWKAVYDKVKAIDPNISVSTTGVMTESPQILIDALKAGAKFDKYQFHCYPWGWGKSIASALPPEMNMIPAAKKMVAVAGDIPCIIGEWGYDLHPDSNMGVRPFSNYTGEQVRSFWICRSLLGFAKEGIESAFYYRIYQDYGLKNDTNATIFETSSLFIKDDQTNITRRLSGDVFYQLSHYGDFVFDSALVEDGTKCVYKFVNGTKSLFVGWTIEQVKLVTINGTNRAEFTETKADYTLPDGTVLHLSSAPTFYQVDGTVTPTPEPTPTKEIYHRGYWTINSKRVFYINYTDGTWTLANGKYVPL